MGRLVFLPIIFLTLSSSLAIADQSYLDQLLAEASAQNLADQKYWHILLRYKASGYGYKSFVDDPAFFLSENGKFNPGEELNATIRSFFTEFSDPEQSTICQFPARLAWLKEKLNIDISILPKNQCSEFDLFSDKVNPKSVTLIFPAAFMNSPASMFGHTLLRLDSSYDSKLISYAVSYAAHTGESSGMAFAIKGIFGNYKGYFSILPYYDKVKEYSDMDQRDIWEYSLNLTEAETYRMFLYIWESRNIYSDYYFFDENCSYALLFLLEAARPEINLTTKTGLWVTPSDTVRIINRAGLVEETVYRPSMAVKIKKITAGLNEQQQKKALQIADNTQNITTLYDQDIDQDIMIGTLNLATELIQKQYTKNEISPDEYKHKILKTLRARSKLGRQLKKLEIPTPFSPDSGHGSSRASVGIGWHDDRFYTELRYRPAYHNIMDPDDGYLRGSQILFSDISLRYYKELGQVKIHEVDLIDIVSIAPRDRFFKHLSWKVRTGLFSEIFLGGEESLVYRLNPGFGVARQISDKFTTYGFIETDLLAGGKFEHNYSFGAGITGGLIARMSDSYKVNLEIGSLSYKLGDQHNKHSASMNQNIKLSTNISMGINLKWYESLDEAQVESLLKFNFYH